MLNVKKAEEMIRRDVQKMQEQHDGLVQQRGVLDQQIASLKAAIDEWSDLLKNEAPN